MAKLQLLCALLFCIEIIVPGFAAVIDRDSYGSGYYNSRYQGPIGNSRSYYNSRFNNNAPNHYSDNRRAYYALENRFRNPNLNVAPSEARIIGQDFKAPENGAYSYSFETENGIQAEERAVAVPAAGGEQAEVVEGSYSFVTPEGLQVLVRYTADERGFHPTITYAGVDAAKFSRGPQAADVLVNERN